MPSRLQGDHGSPSKILSGVYDVVFVAIVKLVQFEGPSLIEENYA